MKSFTVIGVVVVLAVIGLLAWKLWPTPPAPLVHNEVAVKPEKPHVREEVGTLPIPDVKARGVVRVKVRVPITKDDKPGTVKEAEIEVTIPKDEETPPKVTVPKNTGGVFVEPEYQDFRDPFLKFKLNILAGVSAEPEEGPSLYAAVSFLTVAEKFRLGAGVDRFSVGPAVHWEFWREFNLGAKWNVFKLYGKPGDLSVNLSYRF